ncbi:unnamed protein product [Urochloa humidicola]
MAAAVSCARVLAYGCLHCYASATEWMAPLHIGQAPMEAAATTTSECSLAMAAARAQEAGMWGLQIRQCRHGVPGSVFSHGCSCLLHSV